MSLHVWEWVAGELIVVTLAGHLLVWAWRGSRSRARREARTENQDHETPIA